MGKTAAPKSKPATATVSPTEADAPAASDQAAAPTAPGGIPQVPLPDRDVEGQPFTPPVTELQQLIQALPRRDFAMFNRWYQGFFQDVWDRQMEEDAAAGRGVFGELAEQALRDIEAGRTTPL